MAAPADRDDVAPVEPADTDVAIVGMAGRFPGAPDADALWRRVAAAEDCLVDFSRDELLAAGVPAAVVDDPEYVRRNGVLDDLEMFDAGFFGVGPRDAAMMDPQHRHFMECCWEALETAGHVPERFPGAIGLFAGCGFNTYLLHNLLTNPALVDQVGMFLLRHTANDKDFLTTTVSYKLDLRGPSVNVQTACSTSLVAVHLAVQSLLAFECDLALAGGSTIEVPHRVGYQYHEGEVLSPDGRCRAFDVHSGGTVLTSGAGVVALRRLGDALDDGDPVLAVVKATAINNDGQRKVGYLAPSVDGHADVVKEALAVAGLSGRDIQLLEAHGTGTAVGDPIEVAALTEAFRASTPDVGFCRLVSTKPNIGHLDTAAGVASLIKVVQALRHRTLPPLANHTGPSPLLDLERTPFVLSEEAAPWPGDRPRRAGISSLGVGGTNAHVIVQEAPRTVATEPAVPEQILALSARSRDALDDSARRLADVLEARPDTNLADVAHTLVTGRRAMTHRRVVAATDAASAVAALRSNDRNRVATAAAAEPPLRVAFMFPGGGSQYQGMAAGLDDRFSVFHDVMHDGLARLRQRGGPELAPLLRPDADPDALRHTPVSLPAIFLTSVALARQWMAWGVHPTTFVGHSLGEYAAAHLAGVLTLDGALDLIVGRAELIDRVSGSGAAMLAVPLPEAEVRPLLGATLSLATVNAADECVVAGPTADIEALAARVTTDDVSPTLVPIAAAAHSSMLDPILDEFLDVVRRVQLSPPQVPYLSNLTGTWITAEQATDPKYWVDHLRHTVRFAECLTTVLADGPTLLVELGPGHSLSSYARRQASPPVAAIPALRHPNQAVDDTAASLLAFARAWAAGLDVDLDHLAGSGRRRVRLPGYPFRRERHWIEPGAGRRVEAPGTAAAPTEPARKEPQRITDLRDAFWAPGWAEAPADDPAPTVPVGPWVVVGEPEDPFAVALAHELTARGEAVDVSTSPRPAVLTAARSVVVLGPTSSFSEAVERWLSTASAAVRALGEVEGAPTLLAAVTRGATDATGVAPSPADALALGVVGVGPHEYPDLRTALVDLDPSAGPASHAADARAVLDELFGHEQRVVALRGPRRLVPRLERAPVGEPAADTFRRGGRYLVTGGLGGVGFALASHLARQHRAELVVVASRPVPEGRARQEWLDRHGYDDPTSRRIRRVAALEALGTPVDVVVADLSHPDGVGMALDQAGALDGVIHAAGELRDRPIELSTHEDHDVVVTAKAAGALTLATEMERRGGGLLVLVSSTSTTLMADGQAAYVAANAVLDALAGDRGALRVRTVNFGLWSGVGIASAAAHRARLGIEAGSPVEHPVLSELSRDRDGTVRAIGALAGSHHWVIDEHRTVTGTALLPGTGHVELYLAAAEQAGLGGHELRAVTLLEPLVVGSVPVTVRVSIGPPDPSSARSVSIESDGGGTGAWRLHGEGQLWPSGEARVATVPSRPPDATSVDPLERPMAQLQLGPRWKAVDDAWREGDDVVAGLLGLPEPYRAEVGAWCAHPALVDVATAFGVALGTDDAALYVPVGYDRVTSQGPLPARAWVRATRSEGSSADLLRVDLELGDESGTVLLAVDGLSLRPLPNPKTLAQPTGTGRAGDAAREPSAASPDHHVAPLLALAERLGIRPDEGGLLLERVIASGRPRLVATTIDVDDLRAVVSPAPPATAAPRPATGAAGAGGAPDSVAATIRAIWVDLLGVTEIGDDDDFFDVGGHSLIAIRLMSRIHKELGVRFQLATIFEAPTVATLAAKVLEVRPDLDDELAAAAAADTTVLVPDGAPATPAAASVAETAPAATATATPARPALVSAAAVKTAHKSLVTISPQGERTPLFVVHGAGGNVLFLWSLARALAGTRPIYGFQAHGVDGSDMPDATIEQMAARYVAELRAAHRGPYLLGGYSGGGIVTFEMVRQLQALGEDVSFMVLFDSVPPGKASPPEREVIANIGRNVRRHGLRALRPYIREHVRERARHYFPKREVAAGREANERELGQRDVEALGFVNLFFYFGAVADRYEMGTADVDAAVLKAEWVWPSQPHDYHWGEHITGTLDIAEVPGDHNAMFYPEHAPRLAEVLETVLRRHGL